MSRKAALLFVAASVVWGSSFLLIRVAVRDISPAALVFARTVLGAAFLVPIAVRTRAFHGLRRKVPAVVALTMLNMCLPIFLTAWAEQHISSSVTGILIATDPLFTALLALWLFRAETVSRRQLAGLVLGFAGVVALLGLDFSTQIAALLGAGAVLLSACGYAASALLYRRWLPNAPALGVSTLMTLCSCGVFALPGAADLPHHMPGMTSLLALVTLGIVNTGLLSWVYFALVREAGAAVTSLITYVVPVIALVLGVSLLGETLTTGAVVGLVFIASGTWLATSTRRPRLDQQAAEARTESMAPLEQTSTSAECHRNSPGLVPSDRYRCGVVWGVSQMGRSASARGRTARSPRRRIVDPMLEASSSDVATAAEPGAQAARSSHRRLGG